MGELKERESKSLARWDPFADLDLLEGWSPLWELGRPRSMLRRLFEEGPRPQSFAPAMDLHESGEKYVVTVEIPGASKNDVTVEVDQGVLSISGEKCGQHLALRGGLSPMKAPTEGSRAIVPLSAGRIRVHSVRSRDACEQRLPGRTESVRTCPRERGTIRESLAKSDKYGFG